MKTRKIALLRPAEILAEIEQTPLAYLPLGPIEWHGPHMPLGTDPLNAENAALLAAEQTGGLVLPALYWGTERERDAQTLDWLGFEPGQWVVGMDFPVNSLPSMYASEEVFALVVREQLRLAVGWGFQTIAILSGHGARNHLEALDRLAAEFSAGGQVKVLVCMPFVTNSQGVMEVGHASKIETSMMLSLHTESVDLQALPALPAPLKNTDWAVVDFETFLGNPTPERTVHPEDDPRFSTAEEGRRMIQKTVEQIVERVKMELEI